MIFKDMVWLWATSALVCEGKGFIVATRRLRFFIRALQAYDSVRPMINAPHESSLGRLIELRPEAVGAVIWPYQCSSWDAHTRLARIRNHYAIIEKIGGAIDFSPDGKISLLDLGYIREGLHVVVDQPKWFLREGQLAINLFLGDVRMYTLAFSLFHQDNAIEAFVGAIQGRDIEGVLEEYRELTKASHGIHPRNLLIKIFQMFCAELGVTLIFAVSDEYRNHRNRQYFGDTHINKLHANYDEIWTERGGVRVDPMFYQLDVGNQERDLASMSSTKRKKYRRRIELLRRIEVELSQGADARKVARP